MSSWAPTKYKTTNWSSYNDSRERRGSQSFHWPVGDWLQSPLGWFDPEIVWVPPPNGKPGRH